MMTMFANRAQFDCHHFTKANAWLVQRYGKDGGIDWDLNVDPKAVVEPSKTGQPVDPKDSASTKENDAPAQEVKEGKKPVAEDNASDEAGDPEADIDSDEEAALREAGL